MAVPLIVGIGAVAVGLYKGSKAILDNNEANDIQDSAKTIVEKSEKRLDISRQNCQKSLEILGQRKVDTLTVNVKNFLDTFSQIKNVKFSHDANLGNLSLKAVSKDVLQSMQNSVSFLLSSGLGAGTGLVSGALTAFGAYSGTMTFATAGTGTAISSLSGVAATNATLAWLGGGTGGLGMAGGMMALGALTAGPALLIAGWYVGSKVETKLNEAHSNLAEAREFCANTQAAIALTDGIATVAERACDILSGLRKYSRRGLKRLQDIIDEQGTDYDQYNDKAKEIVMYNFKIVQVIKAVLDTPILDEQGNLLGDTGSKLIEFDNIIQNNFSGVIGT